MRKNLTLSLVCGILFIIGYVIVDTVKVREFMTDETVEMMFDPEESEIWYECYSCGYHGQDFFEQEATLFDGEKMLICVNCGGLLEP